MAMPVKHKIVALIGSTRREWKQRHLQIERELCLGGFVVLGVNLFKADVEDFEAHRAILDTLQFQKIRMADAVVLIDKDAQGEHTEKYLAYAREMRKPIVVYDNAFHTKRELLRVINGA